MVRRRSSSRSTSAPTRWDAGSRARATPTNGSPAAPASGCSRSNLADRVVATGARRRIDALEPRLAPVGVDLARAEEPVHAAMPGTDATLQRDAVAGQPHQFSAPLVDERRHAFLHR